jgi:hypothetical protein
MTSNEFTPAQVARDCFNAFLANAVDLMPARSFDIDPRHAEAIMRGIPANCPELMIALRDAFRDNIEDFNL